MNSELKLLGEKLLKEKHQIAKRIHENRKLKMEDPGKYSLKEDEVMEVRLEFIHLSGETLIEQPEKKTATERFLKWGKETGKKACSLGVPLDEALKSTTYYRTHIWEVLREEMQRNNMSLSTAFQAGSLLDPLLDQAVYAFSVAYVEFHQDTLEKSKSAFFELSVPVVPVTKGLAILPLIGNVDTERAGFLMEEVLQKSSRLQLTHLLFDLSGVSVVDTMVADQIFKIENALSLIGVETILIGIRPEVAQTMVNLGIDLSELKVKSNLAQAIKDLQQSTELFN